MSRVQKPHSAALESTPEALRASEDTGPAAARTEELPERTVRLCFRDNVNGADLLEGVVLTQHLPSDASLDTVVVRGLHATAYSNPVGSDVVASAQLVDNSDMPLHECSENESGWLHLNEDAPSGFTPMMNLLPYETSRKAHALYKPVGALKNEELINRYSGVTTDSLARDMVGMPGESYYYVDKVRVQPFVPAFLIVLASPSANVRL